MAKIKVEVEVSKEAYELGQGVVNLLEVIKKALVDGWDLGVDLPAILVAAVQQLSAVEGIDKLGEEYDEDLAAFSKAFGLSLADAVKAWKQKPSPEAPAEPAPAV